MTSWLAGFLVGSFVHWALFAALWRCTVKHDHLIMEAQRLVIEQLELQLDAYLEYGGTFRSAFDEKPKYSPEELKDRNQLWAGANSFLRRIK